MQTERASSRKVAQGGRGGTPAPSTRLAASVRQGGKAPQTRGNTTPLPLVPADPAQLGMAFAIAYGEMMRANRFGTPAMRKQLMTIACLALLTHCAPAAEVPDWVSKAIADQETSGSRSLKIEACTYDGKTVYLFTRLDVTEASNADTLFSSDGQRLCGFGEFAPPGAPRACEADKLVCQRTLYPPK